MGMDIQIKPEEVFHNEDRSWLGTRDGMLNCRSVTLNSEHFDGTDHLDAKGAVQSGTPIVLYADGQYGPYVAGAAAGEGALDAAGNNGHLFSTTKIDVENAASVGVALYWTGVVKFHKLPEHETVDHNVDDAWLAAVTSIRYEDAMNNRIEEVPA